MNERKAPRLLLVDGNNVVHRAFHALPPLSVRRTGELVNAVFGFSSMLLKVISEQRPTHYAVAFDKKGPTFRHNMFEDYKSNRQATPDELIGQLSRVRQLVLDLKIPLFEMDGFEADDMLGTLAHQAAEQGLETIILTGDADAMQLVGPHVRVLYPRTMGEAVLMDAVGVEQKYGVPPRHIADLKALKGDPSDNIPGVKGIGEKTAVRLIQQYGSVEEIYQHIDDLSPLRIQELLRHGEESARRCKVLATIEVHSPVTLDLEKSKAAHFDREKAAALFRELEFFKLLDRLPGSDLFDATPHQPPQLSEAETATADYSVVEEKKKYDTIKTSDALLALAARLRSVKRFALEIVSEGLHSVSSQLVGMAFSPVAGEAYYIPLTHAGLDAGAQLSLEEVRRVLSEFLCVPGAVCVHNANFAMTMLAQAGIPLAGVAFDTMIAAHLLGEQALELSALALSRLNMEIQPLAVGTGSKRVPVCNLMVEQVAHFICSCADAIGRLRQPLADELEKEQLLALFIDVELPLVPLLVEMQCCGVLLDANLLTGMSSRLGERLVSLEREIYALAKCEFNINSPKQLGEVLFEKLRLPTGQKKHGAWSTDSSVLELLRQDSEIADYILEYRQLNKLKATYIDALPRLVNNRTGRVHTSFNQTRTTTGRLSSSDPNLQNIPVRGEFGREIRQAFIAPPGYVLLSGDYSQIDLRSLAHLSQDAALLDTFERGEDVHSATAAHLFNVEQMHVTRDMRRLAKTVNFGVIYGMSGYGLEQSTEFSRSEAEKFIASYFDRFPGVRAYMDKTKEQVRRLGYVQTILGRRRYIPEINSHNRMIREAAERMAINMPVQGTSADIIKVAMLHLDKEMAQRGLLSKLILQVHDELIFEVPQEELPIMRDIVMHLMQDAIKLDVPVQVDIKVGHTWGLMQ
ncbi:MAG: DNA polymerase I [Dehalococcoidia bacterium]|nr:DNA polymerase I [Dehalococcoidia bacterium]